jgi:four helix bundle protein
MLIARMRDYTKIEAWKITDDLAVSVYELTRDFPRDERYGIISQLRRAAVSVPTNIAEGSARESKKDYLHFLYIARGSLSEVQYLIHLAARLGYGSEATHAATVQRVQHSFRCLHGLVTCVEKETGRVGRAIATITSILALSISHISSAGSFVPGRTIY